MTTQAKSEHSEVKFRVTEFERGAYISTRENLTLTLFQNDTNLFFTLNDDSMENAQAVMDFLNKHIRTVATTFFEGHPMY